MTDEELMLRYQNGDEQAFSSLYKRKAKKVYGYLAKKLNNRELRDECFQDIFLTFHKSRARFESQYTVDQWLFVIARSRAIDYQRRAIGDIKRVSNTIDPDMIAGAMIEQPTNIDSIPWEALNADQKKVVTLRAIDELSYEEISRKTSFSQSNLRQIFSRAIKLMQAAVAERKEVTDEGH